MNNVRRSAAARHGVWTALVCVCVVGVGLSLAPAQVEAQSRGSVLGQGRFEIGVNAAGVLSKSTITSEEGEEVSLRSSYFNPNVFFGYTVIPRLQLKLLAGYQSIGTESGGTTLQDSNALSVVLQSAYYIPVEREFSLYGGVGLGGYFGSTKRPFTIPDENGVELEVVGDNSTNGFIFQAMLGALVEPNDKLTLRAGVRFDTLRGTETPEEENVDRLPELTATNLQVLIEFSIGFRFGGGR